MNKPDKIEVTWRDQLQDIMEREGITRIARWDGFYSVAITGDILGTGKTLAEAYDCATQFKQVAA